MILPTLHAGRHRNALPVQVTLLRPFWVEFHGAALGHHRNYAGDAELNGFFDDPVHSIRCRNPLEQCDVKPRHGDAGHNGRVNFNRAAVPIRTQNNGRCASPSTIKDFEQGPSSESKNSHGMMRSLGRQRDPCRCNELVWREQKSGLHQACIAQNPRC